MTKSTGFTGSHSVRALVAAGHDVRLLVRSPEKAKRVFEAHGLDLNELVVGDMGDPGPVAEALQGCDALLHAAAMVDLKAQNAARVIAINAATWWMALRDNGVDDKVYNAGRLLREH